MTIENNELHDEEVFLQFDNLINGLQTVKLQINTLQHSVKQIEKTIKKRKYRSSIIQRIFSKSISTKIFGACD